MSETQFHYSAMTTQGRAVAGEIEAADLDQALAILTSQGLRLDSGRRARGREKAGGSIASSYTTNDGSLVRRRIGAIGGTFGNVGQVRLAAVSWVTGCGR